MEKKLLHLLICEDEENDAALLVRQIEKDGFTVEWKLVDNETALMEQLSNQQWDIILSDFNIPGFGGEQALKAVQQSKVDIPFILVSGTIGEEIAVNMMKLGASDYLMKGNLQRLSEAIKRELEEYRIRKERIQAEHIINVNQKKYKAIIENALFAIFIAPPSGFILESNQAAVDMFGYTKEEFLQLNRHNIFDTSDPVFQTRTAERDLTGSTRAELTAIKKNGERFPCEVTSVIFKDVEGQLISCTMLSDISKRRKAAQQLSDAYEEMKQLSTHLKQAREDERKFIAREIHDEAGQLATGILLELHSLKNKCAQYDPVLVEKIDHAMKTTTSMIDATRRIAASLRPLALDKLGLNEAIRWQCEQMKERGNAICSFTTSLDDTQLTQEEKTELFRICQESLTNVMRHAEASEVVIVLKEEQGKGFLSITDNGKGFDTSQKTTHLGLVGIRERAHSLNGTLKVNTEIGKGTSVEVIFPLGNK